MKRHLQSALDGLKQDILSLGTMVEEQVGLAIKAFDNKDADLCHKIIEGDLKIDKFEVQVEEECLKIIALHQPVAVDLRFLNAVLGINSDLERIGDEAVNIAERVLVIAKRPAVPVPFDYEVMTQKTKKMLMESLDSLVKRDVDMAYKVILKDDEVDAIKDDIYDKVKASIRKESGRVGYLINLLLISRHLERIADHATNIAEEVIYMIEGIIPRHFKSFEKSDNKGKNNE
ncbi:phosphate signaling complex protein PhoU [Thermodesulfobacteriota bacterium]